jgi:hypothetical protein
MTTTEKMIDLAGTLVMTKLVMDIADSTMSSKPRGKKYDLYKV